MKVFRVLFLILIVMSSIGFAQTEENTEMPQAPQAVKVVEFGKVTNGYIKMQLDYFFTELSNNPSAQGYIINFGTKREIARVEKVIRYQVKVRNFDLTRITFVSGGAAENSQTQFWLVPVGAENPAPEYTKDAKEPK